VGEGLRAGPRALLWRSPLRGAGVIQRSWFRLVPAGHVGTRGRIMKKHPFRFTAFAASLAFAALVCSVAVAQSKKTAPSSGNNWSGATAISPVGQPDPTRGAQLNDVAVNASGLTVAAWDQYTYNTGGPYTIGVAVQSGGRWGAPFTISGTTGFSMNPKVAVGADGSMAVSWVHQDTTFTVQEMQVAVKSPAATGWTTTTLAQGPICGVAITGFVPIGIDTNGNVTAAWTLWDGTRHVVQAATLPKGGVWSAPVSLSGPTTDGLYLSLAVNRAAMPRLHTRYRPTPAILPGPSRNMSSAKVQSARGPRRSSSPRRSRQPRAT
jgi:hypothetical protein